MDEDETRVIGDYLDLPPQHREVINNCIAEAWRNVDNGDPDAQSEADVAADVAQHLVDVYGVVTYPKEAL